MAPLACLLDDKEGIIGTQSEGAGSCPGDSGGGLFLDNTATLVGVHRGSRPTCTAANRMEAVSIAFERPFIDKVLRDEPLLVQEEAASSEESDDTARRAPPPPSTLAPVGGCAAAPARYALEMNAGWFASRGVKAGDVIRGIERLPAPR